MPSDALNEAREAQPYAELRERLLATVFDENSARAPYRRLVNPNGPAAAEAISTLLDRCIALEEALDELEKDPVIAGALGEHVTRHFLEAKRQEWRDYITQVTDWELENYLLKY